ncbi:MAG: leucine-rich repeat domain-containing protein [Prevotella sp.]|nr:leucine-rich repeat domain-containing protein [Prevotella sp.]MCM1436918.1 leucine-rich repeat domain-containing protein [Prevotella sp.]
MIMFSMIAEARELYLPSGTRKVARSEYRDDTTLTVVRIPATVTSIGQYAFEGCVNLRRVILEPRKSPLIVGDYAFYGCESLDSLSFTDNTRLGEGALMDCKELRTLGLPTGMTEIPAFLCRGCVRLESVKFPAGLRKIHRSAFAHCVSLKGVEFPAGLRHIGMNVFAFCGSLSEVRLPEQLTTLESYAFAECTSLRICRLSTAMAELGELIFSGCRALRVLEIPRSVPPRFECRSFPFEPDEDGMYKQCELVVPSGGVSKYRSAHGWSLFKEIVSN